MVTTDPRARCVKPGASAIAQHQPGPKLVAVRVGDRDEHVVIADECDTTRRRSRRNRIAVHDALQLSSRQSLHWQRGNRGCKRQRRHRTLAPCADYAAGVQRVLPQYDNTLTRDWLISFLLDCGVERSDGEMHFRIEDDPSNSGLKRIAAYFVFSRRRQLEVAQERFVFSPGESIRLFFSYRHTPTLIRSLLGKHGMKVVGEWITQSQEEGVLLVLRNSSDLSRP